MTERPFAYVCSPFRGDMEKNIRFAREYLRRVFDAGYCPIAPHLLFPQFLDDTDPAQRQAGLEMGLALLTKCRLLVVCGADVTEGMEREIEQTRWLDIPVYSLDSLPLVQPTHTGKTSLRERLAQPCPQPSGNDTDPEPERGPER